MQDQFELTPDERELEQALRSLRPAPARLDVVTAAHAAGRRSAQRVAARRFRPWQAAAALAAVAAGVAWFAFGPSRAEPEIANQHGPVIVPHVAAVVEAPIEPPMVLAYYRALRESPAELDAMLDRQATTGIGRDQHFMPVGAFGSWDANLSASLKEM